MASRIEAIDIFRARFGARNRRLRRAARRRNYAAAAWYEADHQTRSAHTARLVMLYQRRPVSFAH